MQNRWNFLMICKKSKGIKNNTIRVQRLDYDNFLGRLGIGRINKGKIKTGETVAISKNKC